jgi:GTP cyclohydrolase II
MSLPVVRLIASCRLPTPWGEFVMHGFVGTAGEEGFCLEIGHPARSAAPLVRVHSECLTGESLHSLRCDCGEQLDAALARMAQEECGLLVYLRQEGRGIGLLNKIRAYALQDQGFDTVDANLQLGLPADGRHYEMAAAILLARGVRTIRLLTNNPDKSKALGQAGIRIAERIALRPAPRPENADYLRTKSERMGHLLT